MAAELGRDVPCRAANGASDEAPRVAVLCHRRRWRQQCRRGRLRVRRTDASASARHQRLPAQDRRHPELPVGALAQAAGRRRHRAHHAVPRRRAVRRRCAHARRARPRPGAAASAGLGAPHQSTRRRGPAPKWCCWTRRCRWERSDPAWGCPTASCCTAPRSPCPHACPACRPFWLGCCGMLHGDLSRRVCGERGRAMRISGAARHRGAAGRRYGPVRAVRSGGPAARPPPLRRGFGPAGGVPEQVGPHARASMRSSTPCRV